MPSSLRDIAVALVLLLHPEQVAEPHRPHAGDVAQGLSSDVPAQSLCQQQDLGQAELRPRRARFGVEAARDDFYGGARPLEQWLQLGESERRRRIRGREHLRPSLSFDSVPAFGGLGQITEGDAGLFVCAPPHHSRERPSQHS